MAGTPLPSRHAAAWRRAQAAKLGLAAATVATFAGGVALVRAHRPSHRRTAPKPLEAPKHFTAVVRRDLLRGGIVASPQAPPGAVTALS